MRPDELALYFVDRLDLLTREAGVKRRCEAAARRQGMPGLAASYARQAADREREAAHCRARLDLLRAAG